MTRFQIRANSFREIRKTVLFRSLFLMGAAVCCSILISYLSDQDLEHWLYFGPFVVLVISGSTYRALKRQKKIFESYLLTIDKETITREQLDTPTVSLQKNQVTQIIKGTNGAFLIRGQNRHDFILVPAQIENAAELEALLNGLNTSIEPGPSRVKQQLSWLIPLLILPVMAGVYVSENKVVLTICSFALSTLMAYTAYVLAKSKNTDSQTKKISRVGLILFGFILVMAVLKLLK